MLKTTDFLIAGGGPAGATAAALLAAKGNRVQLLDQGAAPSHKVCGEFMSYEALAYLRGMGLNPWQLGAVPLRQVRLAANDLIAQTDLPFEAASLSRKTLDSALQRYAQECGACLLTGQQVQHLAPCAAGWQVTLDDGRKIEGIQAMLATGKHDLRGHARGPGRQPGLVAFKVHLQLTSEQTRKLAAAVEVILFPGGYLGLQPAESGTANLCLLIRQKELRRIGGGWPGVLQHLKASSRWLRERLAGAQECFARPLALSHIPYGYVCRGTQPGLWPIGDQAAVIPSFSGDGIAIALHSAHCAAAFAAAGRDATEYVVQMGQDVQSQISRATRLSRVLVEGPQIAHLLRWFPSLMQHFAQATRISRVLLFDASCPRQIPVRTPSCT